MKKISLIVPVYKDSYKYLESCYNAIKDQDYPNYEIIVVEDGETTPTKNKKVDYKNAEDFIKRKKLKDIKFYHTEHGGAPHARNFGASKATGDIYSFIDPDTYLYSGTLRDWYDKLEENPDCGFVYGNYDIVGGMTVPGREFDPYVLHCFNYISGVSPIRKEAFIGWDTSVKSLQDWDMWLRMIAKGIKGKYFNKSYFITEPPGDFISKDSAAHWIDRCDYILHKNGFKRPDICVTSIGAQKHAVDVAKILGADYLPVPSLKPNRYKMIYLLGFYPATANDHAKLFLKNIWRPEEGLVECKKLVHWIGTDIYQLKTQIPWSLLQDLKKAFKRQKFIMLTEWQHTQKEMKELGINTKIVPIPPREMPEVTPLPKQFTVANYVNSTQDMYFETLMFEVAKAMPDIKFKFFGDRPKKKIGNVEYTGWIDNFSKFVDKCSCLTRITVHDGLPLGALQFALAGRNVLTNTKLPHLLHCPKVDKKEIVAGIRKMQKMSLNKKGAAWWRKQLNHKKFKKSIRKFL